MYSSFICQHQYHPYFLKLLLLLDSLCCLPQFEGRTQIGILNNRLLIILQSYIVHSFLHFLMILDATNFDHFLHPGLCAMC